VNVAPQKPKIGLIGKRAGHAYPIVDITVEKRRRKRHARDAPFVKRRVDVGPAAPEYGRTYISLQCFYRVLPC